MGLRRTAPPPPHLWGRGCPGPAAPPATGASRRVSRRPVAPHRARGRTRCAPTRPGPSLPPVARAGGFSPSRPREESQGRSHTSPKSEPSHGAGSAAGSAAVSALRLERARRGCTRSAPDGGRREWSIVGRRKVTRFGPGEQSCRAVQRPIGSIRPSSRRGVCGLTRLCSVPVWQ